MPTESAIPADSSPPGSSYYPSPLADLKCSLCGLCAPTNSSERNLQDVVVLTDPVERICGTCFRAQEQRTRDVEVSSEDDTTGVQSSDRLGHAAVHWDPDSSGSQRSHTHLEPLEEVDLRSHTRSPDPVPIPRTTGHPLSDQPSPPPHSQSLPSQRIKPWMTAQNVVPHVIPERMVAPSQARARQTATAYTCEQGNDDLPNPLLDVAKARMPNVGRGALYPGSIFRGTQTSGRSAYEVEVRFLVSPIAA